MASFNGGILDIPGLVPVNIGSSNPYPVPSWGPAVVPQMPTQTTPMQGAQSQGLPQSQGQPSAAAPNYNGTAPLGQAIISGFGGGGADGTSPTLGGSWGDQFFNFGNYSGGGADSYGPGGYSGSFYQDSGASPAQNSPSFGGMGIGQYGQSIFDRVSSLTNSPTIRNDNLTQAGINAGALAFPLLGPIAGLLQGFNLIDGGLPTGNAWADVAFTPGASQSITADVANWINRQFGGEYMPYDLGRHTVQDSPGLQYQLSQLANPYDPYSNFAGFTEMPAESDHSSGSAVDYSNQMYVPPTDPYSMTGNMWTDFMQGATFGGGRWDSGGFGGGGGFGTNFGQPSGSADYNGGWGE